MPVPVFTVTVYVVPEPLTAEMEAPVTPVAAKAKSLKGEVVFTPVTDSEKVTVKFTLDAFVGLLLARLIESTIGVPVGVVVDTLVGVKVAVAVGVEVLVAVVVNVLVVVAVAVKVLVGEAVLVSVDVAVPVGVCDGVTVAVLVTVGV